MVPDLAEALLAAQTARMIAVFSMVTTCIATVASGAFSWWVAHHGENQRLKSELRLRAHEQATASVAEAIKGVTDFYVALDSWAILIAAGNTNPEQLIAVAAHVRVEHHEAHEAGLLVPPLLDRPLDTARRLMSDCVARLGQISEMPPSEERASAVEAAIVPPFAALTQFRSMAARWRRATWRELAGPDPVLEDDDPDDYPVLDREWLEAARKEIGRANRGA